MRRVPKGARLFSWDVQSDKVAVCLSGLKARSIDSAAQAFGQPHHRDRLGPIPEGIRTAPLGRQGDGIAVAPIANVVRTAQQLAEPGDCCGEGTIWDAELGQCVVYDDGCPEDLDGDLFISVGDVLSILVYFGHNCD